MALGSDIMMPASLNHVQFKPCTAWLITAVKMMLTDVKMILTAVKNDHVVKTTGA